jgi:hypothetical protein
VREKAASEQAQVDPDIQWRLRNQLSQRLREMLGGDPFHAGLVFIYGLLELLQRERCRALLIASARRWDSSQVLHGVA